MTSVTFGFVRNLGRFDGLQQVDPILCPVQRGARSSREVMILDCKGEISPASSTEVFRAAL